ncbi:MAG: transglutaminase-like domain-containing protein, partial [Noviherbaspirillum sp.]
MNHGESPTPPPGTITVRVGCALAYEASKPVPILLLFRPRPSGQQVLFDEQLQLSGCTRADQIVDSHGNVLLKAMLTPGRNEFRHDAIMFVPDQTDNHALPAETIPIEQLPAEVLRYTLPSRYCESDRLLWFAQQTFGHLAPGIERVQAVCEWTHRNIEYRYGSGSGLLSACDVIARGYGVCRDFAHIMVALCRALDIPARYVAGHMPLVPAGGAPKGDIGIDFHAYCEVYLGGHWHTYDPRHNRPHPGRIKIAHGMDAVDAAFATFYGDAVPVQYQVWAYQVDHGTVRAGDPITIIAGTD